MGKKTVRYNKSGAEKLPNNKPAVYRIQTESGRTNYVGTAKRGRVTERVQEHLADAKIPGSKVKIEQTPSIKEALRREQNIITRTQPKYNNQGK